MQIHTTFPEGVRYLCNIEECNGCCTLFEDIRIYEDEIKKFEAMGYSKFYEIRENGNFLKHPCPFLEGKFCSLHKKSGKLNKFSTCRKYPFSAVMLRNKNIVVDVKWACSGVSLEKGEIIDKKLLLKEFLQAENPPLSSQDEVVYFHNPSRQKIEWEALEKLYSIISDALIKENISIYKSILLLTGLVRKIGSELGSKPLVTTGNLSSIEDFLQNYDVEEFIEQTRTGTPIDMDFIGFSSILNSIFEFEINPEYAVKKLGIKIGGEKKVNFNDNLHDIFTQPLSLKASELMKYYLIQNLRESLTKPWDFISTYFWSLGVAGMIDYIARLDAFKTTSMVTDVEVRKAVRIVDFLNKHVYTYRDFAFEIYPNLGMKYLQFFIAGSDSGLGGY